jgi:hypothetical protein
MWLLQNMRRNELFINNHLMQIARNVDYLTLYSSQKIHFFEKFTFLMKIDFFLLKTPFLERRKPQLIYILNVRTS